jgi:hypothetical protein
MEIYVIFAQGGYAIVTPLLTFGCLGQGLTLFF